MKLALLLLAISFVMRPQIHDPSDSSGTNGPIPEHVFARGEVTVSVIANGPRFEVILSPDKVDADTAIVELFYRYLTKSMKGSDGKPLNLLLSTQAICPVISLTGSACDVVPREGLTLESIEFVRVKFLKTVKEMDHIKAQ